MKTYWFTIADGPAYAAHAARLQASFRTHGLELAILTPGTGTARGAKRAKIDGLLNPPAGCDRVGFVDADALLLDPQGLDRVAGAWRVPWPISDEDRVPRGTDVAEQSRRLDDFHRRYGFEEFRPGGALYGVEWNSGVIVGDREAMAALGREWSDWWDRVLDLFDGRFRRDQVSFRLAYQRVFGSRNAPDLPADCNWIVSYFGLNPNVRILHRTMVRQAPWLEDQWEELAARAAAGAPVGGLNRYFSVEGHALRHPPLIRTTEEDAERTADLLAQVRAHAGPGRTLWFGAADHEPSRLSHPAGVGEVSSWASPADLPAGADLTDVRLVVFEGIEYSGARCMAGRLPLDAVFCFARIHDLGLYRHLFEFEYCRILDIGFGLFSRAPTIREWRLDLPDRRWSVTRPDRPPNAPRTAETGSVIPQLTQSDARALRAIERELGLDLPALGSDTAPAAGYLVRDGRVVGLVLDELGLTSLPESLRGLEALRLLSAADNAIAAVAPGLPAALPQLRELRLYRNRLESLPEDIGGLAELRRLDLEHNRLAALPESLGDLARLESLWANHNLLESLPARLCDLTTLRELFLYDNRLAALPPTSGRLGRLVRLDLKKNRLRELPSELSGLTSLEEFNLWANQLVALPAGLWTLGRLGVLNLRANQLEHLPDGIGQLRELRELYLDHNRIRELPPELGQLTRLTVLKLNGNGLRHLPAEIATLQQLRKLWLRDNDLATLPFEFGGLSNLRELDLQLNRLVALPETFGRLGTLRSLWLDRNGLDSDRPAVAAVLAGLRAHGCRISATPAAECPPQPRPARTTTGSAVLAAEDRRFLADTAAAIGREIPALTPDSKECLGYVAAEGRIRSLRLQNSGLRHLPNSVGALGALARLDLRANALEALPESLGALVALREVLLCHNRLSRLPAALGGLLELAVLDVEDNLLTELPESLGSCRRLEFLWSGHNRLEGLPAAIGSLARLHELHLENNRLAALPPSLGSLESLALLNLKQNQLAALPDEIGNLANLESLNLWNNRLERLPDTLGRLTHLRLLNVRDNALSAIPDTVGRLTRLERLYLDGNRLTVLPDSLGSLRELRALKASANQLEGLPSGFAELAALEVVWLRGNRFAVLPGCLAGMTALAEVDLARNRLTRPPVGTDAGRGARTVRVERNRISEWP